jgi:hypothetical protein
VQTLQGKSLYGPRTNTIRTGQGTQAAHLHLVAVCCDFKRAHHDTRVCEQDMAGFPALFEVCRKLLDRCQGGQVALHDCELCVGVLCADGVCCLLAAGCVPHRHDHIYGRQHAVTAAARREQQDSRCGLGVLHMARRVTSSCCLALGSHALPQNVVHATPMGTCGTTSNREPCSSASPAPLAASTRADSLPSPVLHPVTIATCTAETDTLLSARLFVV